MSSKWKYTNNRNSIVYRTLTDGRSESCLVDAIAEWIAEGNTPESADPPTQAEVQASVNTNALTYLASTDWMVTRFAETGTAIPGEVKTLRQEARDAISRL